MEEVLKTVDLSKKYGKRFAINNVNITIHKGEIYGFVGRNGAGKTTFIRTILGIAKKDNGEIYIFGKKDSSNERMKIGSLIEQPALYVSMTAKDNLAIQAKMLGIKEGKVNDVLELIGLLEAKDKKVRNFSLGMKQRLGIGLALLGDPELLILDEPTNGLDPQGIKEIRELIIKLNKERNMTILISSHILGELAKIATCYGIIDEGKLVDEFTSEKLEERLNVSKEALKANEELENYFMNLMEGKSNE